MGNNYAGRLFDKGKRSKRQEKRDGQEVKREPRGGCVGCSLRARENERSMAV